MSLTDVRVTKLKQVPPVVTNTEAAAIRHCLRATVLDRDPPMPAESLEELERVVDSGDAAKRSVIAELRDAYTIIKKQGSENVALQAKLMEVMAENRRYAVKLADAESRYAKIEAFIETCRLAWIAATEQLNPGKQALQQARGGDAVSALAARLAPQRPAA